MKTLNKVCQILCIVFGLASLVLFFMNFAKLTVNGQDVNVVGSVLAFGGTKKLAADTALKMSRSMDLLFCFIITAIGFVMSAFSFKKKGLRYTVPFFALGSAVYMLVITLSNPWKFVDARGAITSGKTSAMANITNITYSKYVLIATICLFLFAAFAFAYLLIDDALEVAASKGAKKTIIKRIGLFFRDYKSEIKKIVWPGLKDVAKNTLIVLVMCLIVGALIWAVDYGLGNLIKLILGIKS